MERPKQFEDPRSVQILFSSTSFAWLWLILRVWLGYQWIEAALHKVGDPAWVQTGAALQRYWERAVAIPDVPARPLIAFGWYRDFLNYLLATGSYAWFAKLIAYGELLVGIALVLGVLTGIAAFFGGLMNFNFMLAGSASTNPVMFLITVLMILAWKVAGYYGADRYLLPMFGTPWQPGEVFRRAERATT